MGITTCRLEGPVDFYSVGQFVSGPGWRHLRRTIGTFELMFVRRGVLPMRVGEQTLHIEAGQIALLPPNVEHAGADIITSDVDFYWMHFKLPDARMLPDDAGLPQDDHCLLLPDERTLPDPDRLAVMCGQLIDIYARFGPYSNAYCDYFATGLLLEVSAQERLKADFAAHRTLAGYRGDGKPITSADRVRQQQEWAMHVDSAGAAGDSSGLAPMLAIRSWIMANAFDDITVAKVAARFHYSPSYLTAMYRRVFGVGVAEQIIEYRIDRARELLSSTASSVADIAREVGYADPKYFMRVFKRRTGLTPGQYRDAGKQVTLKRHLGSGRGSRESPPYFGVSALPVCRTDSGLARNQCVSNGGARGRHASGFVGPAVALVALLHAAGDHIKRELGELIEIHLDGAQRRCGVRAGRGAVEADDSHIVGHADAVVGKASDYSECGIVVNAEDAIDGRGASRCPRGPRGTGLSSVISRLRPSLEHRLGDGMTGFDAAVATVTNEVRRFVIRQPGVKQCAAGPA